MSYQTVQKLNNVEAQMPLSRFYYPMKDLPADVKAQVFRQPIAPSEAIRAENFLDWLKPYGAYTEHENGYCTFEDGSGYVSTYMRFPKDLDVKKLFWYLNWMNYHPKSQPDGTGNLRYKIWNPADHWDHYFINWKDKSEGIHTTESMDLGEGERKCDSIRHSFSLREYGLTQERIDELKASGISVNEFSDWESFDFEGAHLTMGQIRPCPDGGFERRSVEWIGWRPNGGKIVREPKTPCSDAYLRAVAYHTLLEWHHLCGFIDELYEAYHDLPQDAD